MKVAVKRCENYEPERIQAALSEALSLLGGMENLVRPGSRVLIKPNLLMPSAPARAATTHPEVVRAVIRAVRAAGAQPFLGECPGGSFSPSYLRLVYSQCGIASVAREEDCPVFYSFGDTLVPSPGAQIERNPRVAAFFGECDAIISVAKLKTHGFMGYTGAVKNMFGAVPGVYKAQYHLKYPQIGDFAAAIVDIYQAVKPCLCVVDAVVGMEGDGPSGGRPRQIGALVAGVSGHEVDYICAGMVGMEPDALPTLRSALGRGLLDPSAIDIAGDPLPALGDFALPSHQKTSMVPGGRALQRLTRPFARSYPLFVHAKCTGCGICAANCPPKAIALANRRPRLNRKVCISCFCCHELCPSRAIRIRRFLLFRR